MAIGSIFPFSSSTSTNIGFAPIDKIDDAVATKLLGVTIISSLSFKSKADNALSRASVPFAIVNAYFVSQYFENFFSKFLPTLPKL